MRKNSKQILDEIWLQKEINKFEYKDMLIGYITNITTFKTDELFSLNQALKLTENNRILNKYVVDILVTHINAIMNDLGLTIDGFKSLIELIEGKHSEYEQIRNNAIKSVPIKPSEIN